MTRVAGASAKLQHVAAVGAVFDALRFDDSFVRELPGDPEEDNRRRTVHAAYSRVSPTPVPSPRIVAWSQEVAALVGLPEAPEPEGELAEVLGGNRVVPGMVPYAACYGGHQFGNWAGQLGDGRAITLGEVVDDGQRWELQLKGAGPTPYSRRGDGRAVLRSSVREFLCSEAMHHLGVPTTRALSLVTTGEDVMRDMFYDGNPRAEPGAVVCRVAPSFVRFGNFEIFASREDTGTAKRLADYVLASHFPELGPPSPKTYADWFHEVCRRTAEMIAHWMRVGFVHGVMNTDNMSVLGLTIDYGPYGWVDDFDPGWTPNTTDETMRRYRFGHQPQVAGWNLARFGAALHPLVGDVDALQDGLRVYSEALERHTLDMFAGKLGLRELGPAEDPEDPNSGPALVNQVIGVLSSVPTDMTLFFRALPEVPTDEGAQDDALLEPLRSAYYEAAPEGEVRTKTLQWLRALGARVRDEGRSSQERRAQMHAFNPKYVLRNYLAQLAIDAAEEGDPSKVVELLDVMRRPYDEQAGRDEYSEKRPEWAKDKPGCSRLSCSS